MLPSILFRTADPAPVRSETTMTYDAALTDRIRAILKGKRSLTDREMFGGIGFMIRGNMACGVIGEDLIVRLDPAAHAGALNERHVRPFDFSGRPMKGWIFVASAGVRTNPDLKRWVERGVAFASSLPRK